MCFALVHEGNVWTGLDLQQCYGGIQQSQFLYGAHGRCSKQAGSYEEKCAYLLLLVEYLGHTISTEGC